MDEVKRVVSDLVHILDAEQQEAQSLARIADQLQSCLKEKAESIVHESLDRLLTEIRAEAVGTTGNAVVLISADGRCSVGQSYDINSDSWLKRLRSQGFRTMRPDVFLSFVDSLKSEVAQGNVTRAIEFLKANAKVDSYLGHSPPPSFGKTQPSTPSEWKLSDFLPASPPYPPLPRGLFSQ